MGSFISLVQPVLEISAFRGKAKKKTIKKAEGFLLRKHFSYGT